MKILFYQEVCGGDTQRYRLIEKLTIVNERIKEKICRSFGSTTEWKFMRTMRKETDESEGDVADREHGGRAEARTGARPATRPAAPAGTMSLE